MYSYPQRNIINGNQPYLKFTIWKERWFLKKKYQRFNSNLRWIFQTGKGECIILGWCTIRKRLMGSKLSLINQLKRRRLKTTEFTQSFTHKTV